MILNLTIMCLWKVHTDKSINCHESSLNLVENLNVLILILVISEIEKNASSFPH